MNAAQRTVRAQIAALEMHSQGKTNTAPARAAFRQRFYDQVDPDRSLPEHVREKRAEQAISAHYKRLALLSAKRRATRSAG